MPRNLSEADRKKNQFDKEERVHLLAIMKQYAPLLDKSASTLTRKKIWTTIEDEFKKAGFTRKTSAQLKKYWQNYKYHCKKATAFRKVFVILPPLRPLFFLFLAEIRSLTLLINNKLFASAKNYSPTIRSLSLISPGGIFNFSEVIITKSSSLSFCLIGLFLFMIN